MCFGFFKKLFGKGKSNYSPKLHSRGGPSTRDVVLEHIVTQNQRCSELEKRDFIRKEKGYQQTITNLEIKNRKLRKEITTMREKLAKRNKAASNPKLKNKTEKRHLRSERETITENSTQSEFETEYLTDYSRSEL